jgi:hypothetical protein
MGDTTQVVEVRRERITGCETSKQVQNTLGSR